MVAPIGRDADEIVRLIASCGVAAHAFADIETLCAELDANGWLDMTALVLTEEAMVGQTDVLLRCLGGQPSWSDLPIVILTASRKQPTGSARQALFEELGNTTLLSRPLRSETLRSAIRVALRARSRQHETRRHLHALKQAAETLEARVTERTAELQESQVRLRAMFETSNQSQALIALDGSLLDANVTSLSMIGKELDEVVGQPFWETPWFAGTPGMPVLIQQAVEVAAAGGSPQQEVVLDLPSGRRGFDLSLRPMWNEDGRITAVVSEAVDVTERKLAEESLRQAQKMEAVGQLTGGVAHDFNNLLTVVLGNLALLRRRMAHDPALLRLVTAAEEASRRGAQVNAQLLSFSRRQPLQAVTVDAREVVQGISELLRRTVTGVAELEISLPDEALPIHVDRNQLEMALLNLVVNARDASVATGRIVVEARRAPVDGKGCGAWISVIDAGEGMAPEVLQRVFEPFFTTKSVGAGTGLGLSMVYGFVRQSGGEIDIESTFGKGTRVCLRLPEATPEQTPQKEQAEPLIRPTHGESILVVEDDAAVRAVAVSTLEQLGYPIHEAESGDAALRMLKEGLEVDLLLTDVVMPGTLDGVALAKQARQLYPDLRILVTSGRLPEGLDLDAVKALSGAFIPKPYQTVDLALAVQSILDGEV